MIDEINRIIFDSIATNHKKPHRVYFYARNTNFAQTENGVITRSNNFQGLHFFKNSWKRISTKKRMTYRKYTV